MTSQLSLFTEAQRPSDDQVAWLESFLRDRPKWLTASDICTAIDPADSPSDNRKRQIRELANLSAFIISGQKGYKHLSHATPEEVTHFVHWMEHQAKEMIRRAEAVRKNTHRIIG